MSHINALSPLPRISTLAVALTLTAASLAQSTDLPSGRILCGMPSSQRIAPAARPAAEYLGEKKGLIILVEYADVHFSMEDPQATYNRIANEENFSDDMFCGSVHDYFLDQSNGRFSLTFDVVGPVRLEKPMAFYGTNQNGVAAYDMNIGLMVKESVAAVDSEVDFSAYDWDGDAVADQVFLLYAGYGEVYGGPAESIWPHMGQVSLDPSVNEKISVDGGAMKVNRYACSCELGGPGQGTELSGIGAFCHEFSHCLGLPDLNGSGFGMNSWSIMDYGAFNGNNFIPASYTAQERMMVGWLEPIEVTGPVAVQGLKPVAEGGDAYIIYNSGNRNEYFILENKQQRGWDEDLGGHGLMITHVDYDVDAWKDNTTNTSSKHQRIYIVCADNTPSADTLEGDCFPGTSGNTALAGATIPAAKWWSANAQGLMDLDWPIEKISESADGLISFSIGGAELNLVPADLQGTQVTAGGFTATWTEVPGAEGYELLALVPCGADTPILAEDFREMTADKDGSSDLSSKLDNYLSTTGWTGYKTYKGSEGVKLGSSKEPGYLISPMQTADSENGIVTVTLTASPYKEDSRGMSVSVTDAEGNPLATATISADGLEHTVILPRTAARYQARISADKRAYISSLAVSDTPCAGTVTTAQTAENSVLITGLAADTEYAWWVRASLNGAPGSYSNPATVRTTGDSAVAGISMDAATAEYYTLTGLRVNPANLPAGIYIRRQGSKSSKVIVR